MSLFIENEQISVVWTDDNEVLNHSCIASDQSFIQGILNKYKSVGMVGHSQGLDPKPEKVWGHKVALQGDLHLHGMNFKAAKRLIDWLKSLDLGDTNVTCTIEYAGRICLLVKSKDFWETEHVSLKLPSRYKSKTLYHIGYADGKRYERHFRGDWNALESDFKQAFCLMKTQEGNQPTGENNGN